jgi:hypothetical protein
MICCLQTLVADLEAMELLIVGVGKSTTAQAASEQLQRLEVIQYSSAMIVACLSAQLAMAACMPALG